jgi:hypothetical protein
MQPGLDAVAASIWSSARRSGFAGSDPYDALRSSLMVHFLSGSRIARMALTQMVRRSPLDLRRILRIPAGVNPKALALFLSSAADCPMLEASTQESTMLQDALLSLASTPGGEPALSPGWALKPGLADLTSERPDRELPPAMGWGYDFPWQGRAFLQPRYAPTAVVTSFVVEAFEKSRSPLAALVARAAGRFVLSSLSRFESPDGICFSYSPLDDTKVYNASLLAARILLSTAKCDPSIATECRDAASEACRFVVSRQAPDGSWRYGDGPAWSWIDGFHTGFVLESLHGIALELGREDWMPAVEKGLGFYRERLFEPDGTARPAPGRSYPLDPHSFAQGAITFLALEDLRSDSVEFAGRILHRAVELLWDDRRKGFIYSRGRFASNRAVHLRWNQAWMLRAICAAGKAGKSA